MPNLTNDPNVTSTNRLTTGKIENVTSQTQPQNNVTSKPDSAMNSNTPETGSSTRIPIEVPNRTQDLKDGNALNKYIDVIYNISLGMISKSALDEIRKSDVQSVKINPDQYIIFASTGESKTNTTKTFQSGSLGDTNDLNYTGDYYNIQSLSFTSFVGHISQNPIVATIWDGVLRMYEPFGFSFREDIATMALQLGYPQELSPIDYVYRLEIWFSGYDPITGNWTSRIPIPCPQPGDDNHKLDTSSIIYYLVITTAEAKSTPAGTFYDLSFQTVGHYATRPEVIMMHQDNINKGGTQISARTGQTFRQFLQELANRLNQQVKYDTNGRIDIIYEFVGFKDLLDAKFISDTSANFSTGVSFNTDSGSYAVAANNIDIYTLINHVMANLPLVRDLFLREDDPEFTEPGVAWNIRTNVKQATSPDDKINSNSKYILQYIFEPVFTFRSRTTEVVERNKQTYIENQQKRSNNILNYGMLLRIYDYYFTSDNTDIIDFQFKFKFFYYAPIPYPGVEVTLRGLGYQDNNKQKPDMNVENAKADNTRNIPPPSLQFTPTGSGGDINSLLGISSPPATSSNQVPPAQSIQNMHRGPKIPIGISDTTGEKLALKYLTARDQYLRYDMINAQMTIRFDPIWLMNPYMSGKDYSAQVSLEKQEKSFVYALTDRVIFIRAYRPNQKSFMNPDPSISNIKKTPVIGGFYQVITVNNIFEGGRFYQQLNMIKYDHLNYYDLDKSSSGSGISNFSSNTTTSGSNTSTNQPSGTDPNRSNTLK